MIATLDVLERANFAKDPTIGEIAVACAIGYVEFRMPDLEVEIHPPQTSNLVCADVRISLDAAPLHPTAP